jgi:NTE family protein
MIKQTRIIRNKILESFAGCIPVALAIVLAGALAGCAQAPVAVPPVPTVVVPEGVPSAAPVPKRPPRIGLALGGGAARGFAHVGVIQVLEEAGIRPAFIAGTSAGSLVAAIYASGKTGAQLQQIAETMDEVAITDWTLPIFSRGMFRGEALARYVNTQVGGRLIESFPIPLGIVATDLRSGQSVLFRAGFQRRAGGFSAREDRWAGVCRWRVGGSRAGALCPANGC